MIARILKSSAAVAFTLVVLAGCGGGTPTACYLMDWGGSTRGIQLEYYDALETAISRDVRDGHAVRVLFVRGDPRTESIAITASFADLDALEKLPERNQRRNNLLTRIDDEIDDIEAGVSGGTAGSAITAGIDKLTDGGCEAGLVAYTDSFETAAFSVYRDAITTKRARERLAERLSSRSRTPATSA